MMLPNKILASEETMAIAAQRALRPATQAAPTGFVTTIIARVLVMVIGAISWHWPGYV